MLYQKTIQVKVTVARQIDYRFKQLWTKVVLSGMHPKGELLDYNDKREYALRGTQHLHAIVHVKDAPKLDEQTDDEVVIFIDKYITCAIPDENSRPDLHKIVKRVQTHSHTSNYCMRKSTKCRFGAPWSPSDHTIIPMASGSADSVKKAKKCINKVIKKLNTISVNKEDITLPKLLELSNVSKTDYESSLQNNAKRDTIIYKRNTNEVLVTPYNTLLLNTWKANMNIQYVTGMYGVVHYLTSYLCKSENYMSELMKAACSEMQGKSTKEKLYKIGCLFQKCREVSTHEAIARSISIPLRHSNTDVQYVPTGPREHITRVLKLKNQVDNIEDEDSTDVFAPNILDKYQKRPDELESMWFADFASNYRSIHDNNPKLDDETIEGYTEKVSDFVETLNSNKEIKLKDDFGKMKLRSRPCVIRWHKICKLTNPEDYFLTLLQLYLPWTNENQLKHTNGSYESKFHEVKDDIHESMQKHQPYIEIDYESLENQSESDSNSDSEDDEYIGLRPGILDISDEEIDNDIEINSKLCSAVTVKNTLLSKIDFSKLCSQLNAKQK